eukprot:TRINITY_DN6211_c0_g1_i1.p1 TRINITY_DN6211_c0_g1~~TRINITY_DN6211_c0_g1_i1.p1  ORF type:complete len:380 (+),score=45.03 TRINITY_DN6211_c0_g1_i1:428-1567(+)
MSSFKFLFWGVLLCASLDMYPAIDDYCPDSICELCELGHMRESACISAGCSNLGGPELIPIPKPLDLNNISAVRVFTHLYNFLKFSEEGGATFESTRQKTRDYIMRTLMAAYVPFKKAQLKHQAINFTEIIGTKGKYQKTGWAGQNLLAWTNSSDITTQYAVIAAKYDSRLWWSPNLHSGPYPCLNVTTSTSGDAQLGRSTRYCDWVRDGQALPARMREFMMTQDLLGACVLMELAMKMLEYQHEQRLVLNDLSPVEALYYWDKHNPDSIETGVYQESPVLFIFFDHQDIDNLGSDVWTEESDMFRQMRDDRISSLNYIDFTGTGRPNDISFTLNGNGFNTKQWRKITPNFLFTKDFFEELYEHPEEDPFPSKSKKGRN